MRMNNINRSAGWFAALFAIGLCSCEKVVSIDLNQAAPHIVIEGVVTDGQGPYSVTLSKSGNYFEPLLFFPPVSHALVVVSATVGNSDTLLEEQEGTYWTSTIRGVPGTTYTLMVHAEGQTYTATSTMPGKVRIDSLYSVARRESDGDRVHDLYVLFKDPPEPGNYYRLNFHVTEPLSPDSLDGLRYHLYSDKLTNGNEALYRLRIRRTIAVGDTVTVQLIAIDKPTYDYYRTLGDILTSDRSPTSLSPANPNTNVSNGSLGYFTACSVDSMKIILSE
jgi:Domain of unknown function (DUF4249)